MKTELPNRLVFFIFNYICKQKNIHTMKTPFSMLAFFCLLLSCTGEPVGQITPDNSLVISNDISNQQVNAFAEDQFGHIWIGTLRGVNRYNGHEYQQYLSTTDSTSITNNTVWNFYRDSQNRLWVATAWGINLYTEQDCFKRIPIECYSENVLRVMENSKGEIFLDMVTCLCKYLPEEEKFVMVMPRFDCDEAYRYDNMCFIDKRDQLWSVTHTTIHCYETQSYQSLFSVRLPAFAISYQVRDNGEIWLSTSQGLLIFNTATRSFDKVPEAIGKHPLLTGQIITHIHPYSGTSLLLNTPVGLFLYDYSKGTVIHQSENGFPFEPPSYRISCMFTDSHKNLWIGSYDQGYTVRYHSQERFNTNSFLTRSLSRQPVLAIACNKEGNLWIATNNQKLYRYDSPTKALTQIDASHLFRYKTNVTGLYFDKANRLWMQNEVNELIACRYDGTRLTAEKQYQMPTRITTLAEDNEGNFYCGGNSENVYILSGKDQSLRPIRVNFTNDYAFTSHILTLSGGNILIGAFNEDLRLLHPGTDQMDSIPLKQQMSHSKFVPKYLFEDSGGNIWIGTHSNGLYRYNASFTHVQKMEGVCCDDICSIEEDMHGYIWISTLYGLSKYDPYTQRFTNYYTSDGIGGNEFIQYASCRMPDGTLAFGGTHGLTFFDPVAEFPKKHIPLLFENLKVHNRLERPFYSGTIHQSLNYRPEIHLEHDENGFTISFAALDYNDSERVHYFYMMEGFDKYWIDAHNNREAYYSNLPAGKYRFKVRITNNDQNIIETESEIPVIIHPAPWCSWWASLIYSLVAIALLWLILHTFFRFRKQKQIARQADLEKEQELRTNQMNMSFFSNISHEFRTPLTMIAGPVATLCEKDSISEEDKNLLRIVQRSVNRMLKLVNQMLDFHKLENDALRLNVQKEDIIELINDALEIFKVNTKEKSITLNAFGLEDRLVVWIDADKLGKILSNLLSNALKFSKPGDKIDVSVDVIGHTYAEQLFALPQEGVSQYIKVSVKDTGCGIPEDKLEAIFEKYYQIDRQTQAVYNWGTGIGLYYAKRLVELHHGCIKAGNNAGGGATFTFILPLDDAAYTTKEKEQRPDSSIEAGMKSLQAGMRPLERSTGKQETEEHIELPTLLVVDDDTELAHYLKTMFSGTYNVFLKYDATSAYQSIEEINPDLIVCDVVMPGEMNGLDLCRKIKDNLSYCHIPVILLTAKTTVQNQVEGLNLGASAYVTKPFEPSYLLALIQSQLKNRDHTRSVLSQTTQPETLESEMVSPQDKAFLEELYQLMEKELSNPELNITRMTEVMKISRTKFYYKMKGLTGENPNVFFKNYKLNRAAELLQEGRYNVSEIADMTGFSTLSFFSVSFKKRFGVSPSEYVRG